MIECLSVRLSRPSIRAILVFEKERHNNVLEDPEPRRRPVVPGEAGQLSAAAQGIWARRRVPQGPNFMRTLAMPKTAELWSLTSLPEKLIKIGAKVVSPGRYVTFQMVEVSVSRQMFANILSLITRLRPPPAPA